MHHKPACFACCFVFVSYLKCVVMSSVIYIQMRVDFALIPLKVFSISLFSSGTGVFACPT